MPDTQQRQTLGEALPAEVARCQELLGVYDQIGPAGNFAKMMLQAQLARASKAMMEGDVVAMLRSYEELRENEY